MLKKLFWLALLALTVIGANSFAQIGRLSDFDSLRYIASHGDLIQAFGADAGKGRSHYEHTG